MAQSLSNFSTSNIFLSRIFFQMFVAIFYFLCFFRQKRFLTEKEKKMSYKLRMKCLKNKLQKVYCQHGASSVKCVNVRVSCLLHKFNHARAAKSKLSWYWPWMPRTYWLHLNLEWSPTNEKVFFSQSLEACQCQPIKRIP